MDSGVRSLAPGTGLGLRTSETLAVAALFLLLTVWFTYPQSVALASVPTHPDPFFSIWRLGWIGHVLTGGSEKLFHANIFHPGGRTLAYSDAMLLEGVLATPLLWLGVPGVIVYNLLLLGSYLFAGVGMFVLVRTLTGSRDAGVVAGTIFAFAPFRLEHYMHLELLWSGWIPLTLYAFHKTLRTERLHFGLLTGLFLALQFASSVYYGVFLTLLLPIIAGVLWLFGVERMTPRSVGALVVGAVLAAAAITPYGLEYRSASLEVGTRQLDEIRLYSATLSSYFSCPPTNWVCGWTFARWGANEKQLFPGMTAIVLAMFALARGPIGRRLCYAIVLVFAVDLSLGLNGLTYRLLRVLPVSSGLRVPARAAMLVLAVVAILAGYGVARLIARPVPAWASPQRLTAMLMVLLLVEYAHQPIPLERLPTGPSAFEDWLRARPSGVVLHLPLPQPDRLPGAEPRFEFASTFDWHPIVNGYSGFLPVAYLQLLDQMRGFPDTASMDSLRERRVRWIVVHEDEYLGRKGMFVGGAAIHGWGSQWADHLEMPYIGVRLDRLIDALTAWPGVTFVGRFASSLGAVRVYELVTPR